MESKYVWVVTFVGEGDVFVVSSAEKAYQMLYTYAKKYYADCRWLIEVIEMLNIEYQENSSHFGLEDMGYARQQEIDNTEDFDWIIKNMD